MASRLAIVTPCYKESRDTLKRMMASVVAQRMPCHHILVSDGVQREPGELLTEQYRRAGHKITLINLPYRSNNSGAAPRAVGAAWAFSLGIPLVSFLDADNALLPTHASTVVEQDDGSVTAITTARRVFLKDTGEETPIEPAEIAGQHVDTNCLTLTSRARHLLPIWLYWPSAFGTGEDRIFSAILNAEGGKITRTGQQTVLYWSEWPIHYQLAGKPVPATAKRPTRRAATHFNAPSFFNIVGHRNIAPSWLKLESPPIPPLNASPFIAQCYYSSLATPNSLRMLPVSISFADLVICGPQAAAETPTCLTNQQLYELPNGAPVAHGIAMAAVSAYHQGHGRLVLFLDLALNRTETLNQRIVRAVTQMKGRGLVFFFGVHDDKRDLIAVGATTYLGTLWGDILVQSQREPSESSADSSTALYSSLKDACRRHGVASAERDLL